MKSKLRFITTVTALLVLLGVSTTLYGTAQEPGIPHRMEFSKLTLKISSTKEFAQLEPIPMIFNLRNETAQPVVGHAALELPSKFVKFVRDRR